MSFSPIHRRPQRPLSQEEWAELAKKEEIARLRIIIAHGGYGRDPDAPSLAYLQEQLATLTSSSPLPETPKVPVVPTNPIPSPVPMPAARPTTLAEPVQVVLHPLPRRREPSQAASNDQASARAVSPITALLREEDALRAEILAAALYSS